MSASVESHEGKVAITLDLSNLLPISTKLEILQFDLIVSLLTRPFQCLGPSLITQPIADEVRVTLHT